MPDWATSLAIETWTLYPIGLILIATRMYGFSRGALHQHYVLACVADLPIGSLEDYFEVHG